MSLGMIATDRPHVTCHTSVNVSLINLPQDRAYVVTTRLHSRQSVLNRKDRVLAEIMTGSCSAFAWTDCGVTRSMNKRHGLTYPSLSVFGKYMCREMSSTFSHRSGCARTEARQSNRVVCALRFDFRGAAPRRVDANERYLVPKNSVISNSLLRSFFLLLST